MKIAVTGATGFIGSRFCARAKTRGHETITLGRTKGDRLWDPMSQPAPLEGAEAVVHFVGESVAKGRWTRKKMARIVDSRVIGTRNLVAGIQSASPRALVSSSAIGYYGDRGDEELSEDAASGNDFLAGLGREWEGEAQKSGIRTACIRTGIVLGPGGGALGAMLLPFKLGLGGRMGSGRQWMSWIHLDDLVDLFLHAVENESVSGSLNGTAPNPVTNLEFTKTLGKVLGRWTIFPMPKFQIRLIFGKVAEVLVSSQRCVPRRTQECGFSFTYPDLEPALRQILELPVA